ncbi:MAG: Uma2 family endonuclease [Dehalococcoidia bacterium]|nr:Uma2 family endonuclease [Dehalococcoidia bacterium]
MATQVIRRRFTVNEYYLMAQAGILHEDDRVELLEGEIVEMAAIGSRHAACVNRLNRILSEGLGSRAIISVQNPVRLGEHSEPQPDLTLLRPRPDFYSESHPESADVMLLVEVADTSEDYDREVKMPLYARYGITEAWLVDLSSRSIEMYRDPVLEGYRDIQLAMPGCSIAPQAFPDLELVVEKVFG